MGYRGRLLHPLKVRIASLDVAATAADPDGSGPLLGGYDEDYREPVRLDERTTARKEKPVEEFEAQVEAGTWEARNVAASGDSPRNMLTLVFHYAEFEERGLVDTRGDPVMPRNGDRLVEVRDMEGNLLHEVRTPPGMYCVRAEPRGFGLGGSRNLWAATFEERGNAR